MGSNDVYKVVRYTSGDCPEKILRSVTDFYIYIFNNASDHFFVHRETGLRLGRSDIPELIGTQKGYIPNTVINRLYTEVYEEKGYALWHHPEGVLKNIKRKLSRDGQIVLLIKVDLGDKIYGFSFGRRCTLVEALRNEEWIDPYVYSNLSEEERSKNDENLFLTKINDFIAVHQPNVYRYDEVGPDTPVYCWNAAGIAPELQGNGFVKDINDLFFGSIPKRWGNLLLLGEASDKKAVPNERHKPTNLEQFQSIGAKKIMKMDEDLYLIGAPVESFVQGFIKKARTKT